MADSGGSLTRGAGSASARMPVGMKLKPHGIGFASALTVLLAVHADAQTAKGPFARIAILRPHDAQ